MSEAPSPRRAPRRCWRWSTRCPAAASSRRARPRADACWRSWGRRWRSPRRARMSRCSCTPGTLVGEVGVGTPHRWAASCNCSLATPPLGSQSPCRNTSAQLLLCGAPQTGAHPVSATCPACSGTTGRPKGVPLTHANLAASLENIRATYEFTPQDRSLLVSGKGAGWEACKRRLRDWRGHVQAWAARLVAAAGDHRSGL